MTEKKKYSRFRKFILVILSIGFLFYLFVYPVLIASNFFKPQLIAVLVGVLIYLNLLLFTCEIVYSTFARLYHFKRKILFKFLFDHIKRNETEKSNPGAFKLVIVSYLFIVYFFSLTYLFIGNYLPNSFDNRTTFIDSLYLSFSAISVGPSGLEPRTELTKILVLTEVAIGLIYDVLIFSIISSHILIDNEMKGKD